MTIDNQIKDEKLQYNINKKLQKHQSYHQKKLITKKNMLQAKRYCLLIKNK